MKALVIGGSGLVGSALHRTLQLGGVEVVATFHSHPVNGAPRLDITHAQAVRDFVETVNPDVVFLTAAKVSSDYCEDHPEEAFALHAEGTRNVAEAAARCGARVVYYSTDYIFDGQSGPYSEEDESSPINVYGRTKLAGEEIVRECAPQSLILRTSMVYGWVRPSGNFAMKVWECLQAEKAMRIADDQWRNPTLADYLAEVSVRLLQSGAQGIFHVVGKQWISNYEFAQALARVMGLNPDFLVPVSTAELGQRTLRPMQGGLKTEKLECTLGTAPMDLGESLKRFRRQWRADTRIIYAPQKVSSHAEKLKQETLDKVREYYELVHKPRPFAPYRTRIQYSGRVFGEEEMVNLVDSALDFWLTLGPYGDLFEEKVKRYLGARDFVVVNSGSTANLTAVLALMSRQLENPLRPGDEVITPAVTFPTTLAPIVHSGLVPVFVDSVVGTYNVDPSRLEEAISEKTRALMIPHALGNPCDMKVICDLVQRYNLYLIEDCCDALGASFGGRRVGTFGDLATLSFFPAHQITMGEGGGVIVNKPRLSRIVRSVRDWGRDCWCAPGESNTCGKRFGWQLGELPKGYDHKYIYSNIGYNFKPTDLQAAIGVAQTDRISEFVKKRGENFARLYKGLEEYQDFLVLPRIDPRASPSWFGFPITVKNGVSRRELVLWLETANIETREVFAGNILKQPGYEGIPRRVSGTLENTDRIMRDTFFIGVYPGLTDEMIDFVLERFRKFFKGRPGLEIHPLT